MTNQMKRYVGRDLEGSQVQELVSLWSWGAPPSRHVDTFTNPEAFQNLYFGDFYGGFITQG